MRYRLVVLTHGDCAPLEATLQSFAQMVHPAPQDAFLIYDGPELYGLGSPHPRLGAVMPEGGPWAIMTTGGLGFCGATRLAWRAAVGHTDPPASTHEHVFYLEHDFRFTRPVDLRALADVLDHAPGLCQMQLMRDAVSEEERAAGGLFELRRAGYTERILLETGAGATRELARFQLHRMYLTTNPSLMRRDWMAANPWPDYPEQCEGRFGLDLVEQGWAFGVWGDGSPWVTHAGVRTGFGY